MVNTFSAIIVGLGFMLILYKVIRYAEHKADLFAAKIVGNEQMVVLALTKITEYNQGQGQKAGRFSIHPSLDRGYDI